MGVFAEHSSCHDCFTVGDFNCESVRNGSAVYLQGEKKKKTILINEEAYDHNGYSVNLNNEGALSSAWRQHAAV